MTRPFVLESIHRYPEETFFDHAGDTVTAWYKPFTKRLFAKSTMAEAEYASEDATVHAVKLLGVALFWNFVPSKNMYEPPLDIVKFTEHLRNAGSLCEGAVGNV